MNKKEKAEIETEGDTLHKLEEKEKKKSEKLKSQALNQQ